MTGAALAGRVSTTRAVRPQRGRRRARRGRRLRREALDPAPARGRRRVGHGLPARRRRRHARRLRRRAALERARRPRAARRARSRPCASCSAACRCSGSASATSCSRSRPGLRTYKLPVRPPRREPPGASSARRGRVLVTSQNHGFAVEASADRARHARVALRRHRRGRRLPRAARALGAVPPRGRARARTTPGRSSASGSRRCALPRRDDIHSICLIGSGPIVIGQACEFDYAGCQALKVLREDGYRTIVVNSNPATIMTDPGFADRTYLEPLDLEGVADVLAPRAARRAAADDGRPDRAQPRARAARGGRARRARRRADRREGRRDRARRGPRALQGTRSSRAACACRPRASSRDSTSSTASACPRSCGPRSRSAATAAASSRRPTSSQRQVERGLAESPIGQVLVEESRARLGRVRARGRPRPRRQRRDRLLDREPRPDGRPHRRLGHGRAADDALRRGLPGAPRRGDRGHPRGRRRHRRLEHPVRARPRHRRAARDRDEPARLALLGARVEGDRLPDREGRREARGRLHARRDPERPHRARRRRASSRRSTTSSSSCRASRSRSSPAPTRRSARR